MTNPARIVLYGLQQGLPLPCHTKRRSRMQNTGFVKNANNQMEIELATSISLGSMVLCMDRATLTS